jgi:hypothetical protein
MRKFLSGAFSLFCCTGRIDDDLWFVPSMQAPDQCLRPLLSLVAPALTLAQTNEGNLPSPHRELLVTDWWGLEPQPSKDPVGLPLQDPPSLVCMRSNLYCLRSIYQ